MNLRLHAVVCLAPLLFCAAAAESQKPATVTPSTPLTYDPSRGGGMFGPSIAVDPCFPYYKKEPLQNVCRQIRRSGFTCVNLIDYGANDSSPAKLKAFAKASRSEGVVPMLSVYPGTHAALYSSHPEWRQKMLTGIDGRFDWRTWLCPNQPAFVSAYCAHIERQMREGGFDGIRLAEIWFENWGGPEINGKPNPNYACVCEACIARFRRITGVDAREMLTVPSSQLYFKKSENTKLYARWVKMRVQTIQDFGQAIIAAARKANPRACINIMYMADANVKLDGGREYLANDLDRMLREWKPDILTFEDAWQDWGQKKLAANFVAGYAKAYKQRVEKLHPGIFIMSHADIGSRPQSKRSPEWIRQFAENTVASGFGAPSFYEWHISTLATSGDGSSPEPASH